MVTTKGIVPLLLSTFLICNAWALGQKRTAEEVVSKHLESIGSADAREQLKNQMAIGLVQYTVLRAGGAGANGRIVFASEAGKSLLGMTFPIPSYPAETIVYDGSKIKVAYINNNVRSQIGDYLYRYDTIVRDGLLGGVLSTRWPLYDLSASSVKVEFNGTKKIDGEQYLVLSYSRKGGADVDVKLYFDPETFRHVRTEYRRMISSQMGSAASSSGGGNVSSFPTPSGQGSVGSRSADASSSQRELRQYLTEEFSEFKTVNGLTMPHKYRAYLLLDGTQGTREYEWKAVISDFFVNQPIDPAAFSTVER